MKLLFSLFHLSLVFVPVVTACKKEATSPVSPRKTPTSTQIGETKKATPAATATPVAKGPVPTQTPASALTPTPPPSARTPEAKPSSGTTTPTATAPTNPVVVIKTNMGTIEVELDPVNAPITTRNFLSYVSKGHYDGTVFHRVISTFMIQGGGLTPDLNPKPADRPIKNEATNGLRNLRGTIAMARTGDPDSATCQFFINVVNNAGLDYRPGPGGAGYAVFGKVVSGMDVVDKIRNVPTQVKGGMKDVPVDTVLIESIKLKK